EIEKLERPRFQRELKDNNKVGEFRECLKKVPVIAGVITLGYIPGDPILYKVDGQHRLFAATGADHDQFIATIHITRYVGFAEMAQDFVKLNGSLVRIRKDDILRAAMESCAALKLIVDQCPFVTFDDNVRRATSSSKLLSMSSTLRCWIGSANDTP